MQISKLQYITDKNDNYTHQQLAEKVCKAGCKWVQLRVKNKAEAEWLQIAKETVAICHKYNALAIINDNVLIARQSGADGVHIGKSDMSAIEARKILGDDKIIGCTADTYEEIEKLSSLKIDYIGLGPLRFTTTKEDLSPILGIIGYSEILSKCLANKILIPIIAIGGITTNDIPGLLKTGVYGVAISSSITKAPDIEQETKKLLNLLK